MLKFHSTEKKVKIPIDTVINLVNEIRKQKRNDRNNKQKMK